MNENFCVTLLEGPLRNSCLSHSFCGLSGVYYAMYSRKTNAMEIVALQVLKVHHNDAGSCFRFGAVHSSARDQILGLTSRVSLFPYG